MSPVRLACAQRGYKAGAKKERGIPAINETLEIAVYAYRNCRAAEEREISLSTAAGIREMQDSMRRQAKPRKAAVPGTIAAAWL
jgi:hypothetical protein